MQVGAQNAGKSSLINAMRRAVGHKKPREDLTIAAMPGTTLGAQDTAPQCCLPLPLRGPQKGLFWQQLTLLGPCNTTLMRCRAAEGARLDASQVQNV